MKQMRIALAQLNCTVGDFDGNLKKMLSYSRRAEQLGADMICFPEMAITGYPPEDLLLRPGFIKENLSTLQQYVQETETWHLTSIVGFVDHQGDIFNAAAVIHGGSIHGIYHKMYLPNYGVFDEYRYFRPGNSCGVFELSGITFGLSICEDIWYPDGPTLTQAVQGRAELVINISSSPYQAGKFRHRQRMLATRASDNTILLAYVNLVGGQDELVFDGGSMVINQEGDILALASQFQEELLLADLPIDDVFRERLLGPRHRLGSRLQAPVAKEIKRVPIPVSEQVPPPKPEIAQKETKSLDAEAEIYEALVCGVRDYVDKNSFASVVIGLSGGIDSALVACIATDALGPDRVVGVSMPSSFTSDASRQDGKLLAERLGIRFLQIPIHAVLEAYKSALQPSFQGREEDVTEENLQARIRGNYLMALSNKFGWLVLTTGNKSEMGVGYCTLYGDMAGGFAALKDVPKTLVQRLSRFRNRRDNKGGPIPENTLNRPPSAELRPEQKDTDSLPDYSILDPILTAFVEDEKSPEEIVPLGFDADTVRRVVKLIDRSEYKRRQGPPGIKITSRAFGRDRRMPLTYRSSF